MPGSFLCNVMKSNIEMYRSLSISYIYISIITYINVSKVMTFVFHFESEVTLALILRNQYSRWAWVLNTTGQADNTTR